ncbi:MAG: group III truncated hemoglobin [Bacteroidetes bacterium]|nr:group III truncated hemoglobin [Bacteroidota bacterium]
MNENLKDIQTEEDIKKLVDAFYEKVMKDEDIGHYFSNVNWGLHLPVMYNFWSSLMFQTGAYSGYPFLKHEALNGLKENHFKSWIALFIATVNEHFAGEKAESIKQKASQIATVFSIKLGLHREG